MRRSKMWVVIVLAALCAGLAAWLWQGHEVVQVKGGNEPAPSTASSAMKVTGNYSADWMTYCGPLKGPAQKECEARLDASYGKSDAAPVPSAR